MQQSLVRAAKKSSDLRTKTNPTFRPALSAPRAPHCVGLLAPAALKSCKMMGLALNTVSAGVAQLVEQLIRNEKVEGSIPFSGTN